MLLLLLDTFLGEWLACKNCEEGTLLELACDPIVALLVVLQTSEKEPLLFRRELCFSFVEWLFLRMDFDSHFSGESDARAFRNLPMLLICCRSPLPTAIDSMRTMFQRLRIAIMVALLA